MTVADYDAKQNQFTVELPIPTGGENGIYVLCYTADIIDLQNGSYGNSIRFRGSTSLFGGEKDNSASVSGGGGGGGGGGVAARKATLLITKTDEESGQPLQGVTFVLYSWDSKTGQRGLAFSQAETDENGKLSFRGLKPGAKYELVETSPKSGYSSTFACKTASDSTQIEWTKDGKCIITAGGKGSKLELELTNKKKGKDVACKLITEDGVPLAGEQVELNPVDDEGNSTGTGSQEEVLADGTVIFPNVRPGRYQLIDASGNVIVTIEVSDDASTVTATLPDNSIVDLENPLIGNLSANRKIWKLTVKKVDADEKTPLSGAVFALYAEDACKTLVQQKKTSGADGIITFSGLIEGQTYYLKELSAPDGYQLKTAIYEVDKDAAEQMIENVQKSSNKPDTPEEPEDPEEEETENPGEEETENPEKEETENPEEEETEDPKEEETEDSEEEETEDLEKEEEESKNPGGSEDEPKDSEASGTWEGDKEALKAAEEEDSRYLDPDIPKTGDPTWWLSLVTLLSGVSLLGLTLYKIWIKKHHEQK